MPRTNAYVFALNAGGIDPLSIGRVDLEKMRLAGEHPVKNWLPYITGPMSIRPGFEYVAGLSAQTFIRRFAKSISETYLLLLSANEMRILNDGAIVQIPSHSSSISTGGWSDVSDGTATATGGATLSLNATASSSARLRQTVTVGAGDIAVAHILRIVVTAGPVFLRVGTVAGGQDVLTDSLLEEGTHKIAFTPGTTTVYVDVRSDDDPLRTVSQIDFEARFTSGDLVLPTPWSADQLQKLRSWQSIDIVYCGDGEQQQRQIEHRGPQSWSVVRYKSYKGPYSLNPANVTLTPSNLSGNITVTSSASYFQSGHVGALIEMTHSGKTVTQTLDGEGQVTDYITVDGINAERIFYRTAVSSSFVGTLTLQRSVEVDNPTVWSDFATYTAGFGKTAVDDDQDNLVANYRFTVKTGNYTSGSIVVTLEYDNTIATGHAAITGYTNSTTVSAEVRTPFGATTATRDWRIGTWSNVNGWPRVPVLHDDRLHWFDSKGRHFASEVDDYVSFDDTLEGDSAPFTRSVSGGALETVMWAQSEGRLVVGTTGYEATIQANDLDEPLTPTAYTSRLASRFGCADIESASHHSGVFYIQRAGQRIYELSIPSSDTRYRSLNVSRLNRDACKAGAKRIAVQIQPETRLYVVLDNGTVVVVTYAVEDDVIAFTTIELPTGSIEDIAVLPGQSQDFVYIVANRAGQRSVLMIAEERAQEDASTCALLDYHKEITGPVSSISGASHLASQTVNVWADGARRGDVVLDGSGNGSLDGTYQRVVYGLGYSAEFKSTKLAYVASLGTPAGQPKIVRHVGMLFRNSCLDGISVGFDENNVDSVPSILNGAARTPSQFYSHLELAPFPVPSNYDTDSRVYIEANSKEGPVTVQALILDVETREGNSASGQN